jgi:hypothetical protein
MTKIKKVEILKVNYRKISKIRFGKNYVFILKNLGLILVKVK